jgi:hypothetical protein
MNPKGMIAIIRVTEQSPKIRTLRMMIGFIAVIAPE